MISLQDNGIRLCDGVRRREFLRAGGLGLFGLTCSEWLKSDTAAANEIGSFGKAKRCIVLFLTGGPPQHSTWDPKPHAPSDVQGVYGAISTAVPGVQICELLPKTARLMNHVALLRAVTTGDHAHSSSGYAMLTGRPHSPLNRENANPGAPNDWPTMGAVVQHLRQRPCALPPSIRLPQHIYNTDGSVWPGQDAGFLGATAAPWLFRCEPGTPTTRIPDFELRIDVPLPRFNGRQQLLQQLDHQLSTLDGSGALDSLDEANRQAFRLLSNPQSQQAFDLDQEPASVRDRYGRGQFGQSVLLARRLIEADVSLVQVNWFRGPEDPDVAPVWDSHADESARLKKVLAPPLDMAYSALLEDLIDRNLLDETLVVCMGEFGRSPKFNKAGGRDHWGHVFSLALAGGGIQGGAVHGSSDNMGGHPTRGIVRPHDLTATIFHCLGHRPTTEIHDNLGRPFPISSGRVIDEVVT